MASNIDTSSPDCVTRFHWKAVYPVTVGKSKLNIALSRHRLADGLLDVVKAISIIVMLKCFCCEWSLSVNNDSIYTFLLRRFASLCVEWDIGSQTTVRIRGRDVSGWVRADEWCKWGVKKIGIQIIHCVLRWTKKMKQSIRSSSNILPMLEECMWNVVQHLPSGS